MSDREKISLAKAAAEDESRDRYVKVLALVKRAMNEQDDITYNNQLPSYAARETKDPMLVAERIATAIIGIFQ